MKVCLPIGDFPNYVKALQACGAEVCREISADCGALLLPGGGDIDPALYGQENRGSKGIDAARDRREAEAFRLFLSLGRPIFGVCRGAQLINVLLGGTLHQDITGHRQDGNDELRHGSRTVDPLLLSLYGGSFIVNSTHHQSVDRLGEGLRAVQWADDGTIEAIRHDSLPIFAVQWHPERHHDPIEGWRLFEALYK